MSLKGVELQIAIPKTFDAGKMVDEHQQNIIQQQVNANEALKKETERKQLTVNDTGEVNEITDENEQNDSNNANLSKKKKRHKQQDVKEAKHPYKGNFIDYSG